MTIDQLRAVGDGSGSRLQAIENPRALHDRRLKRVAPRKRGQSTAGLRPVAMREQAHACMVERDKTQRASRASRLKADATKPGAMGLDQRRLRVL